MFEEWRRIRARWPQSAKTRLAQGIAQHREAITARPSEYREDFNKFMQRITRGHARLEAMKPYVERGLVDRQQYDMLVQRYEVLAAGVFADASRVDEPELGAPHVIFIVAGIAFVVVAVVWAVVAITEAIAFDNHTELMSDELQARIQAAETGTALQPTTLPNRSDPGNGGGGSGEELGLGTLVAGGLGLLLAAGGTYLMVTSFGKKVA